MIPVSIGDTVYCTGHSARVISSIYDDLRHGAQGAKDVLKDLNGMVGHKFVVQSLSQSGEPYVIGIRGMTVLLEDGCYFKV